MLIYPENEWNIYDEDGTMLPWYTVPSLNWIKNNLSNDLSVLEIGAAIQLYGGEKMPVVFTQSNVMNIVLTNLAAQYVTPLK